MVQRKDLECGLSDQETLPLLPLKNQQLRQGDSLHCTSSTANQKSSLKRRENASIDNTALTRRDDHDEKTELVTEDFKTVYDESYTGDPDVKKMLEAIERDNGKEIKRLIDSGADPNATYPLTHRQEEYLYRGVWNEDLDGYKKFPTWSDGRPSWSMLQFASASCRVRAARALLARGARAGAALDVAGAAFHYGCPVLPERFSRTVELLVGSGAVAAAVVYSGTTTALHTAARLRCARAAAALLRAGAAWCADAAGLTPLHRAVDNKCEDTLEVLLSHGGREVANAVSTTGASVLLAAVAAQWAVGCAALLLAGASPYVLCTHPVRPHSRWSNSETFKVTPLHLSIELNNTDIVDKILTLSKWKDLECLNSDKETPLHTAIEFGRLACVKLLVQHGASLRNITGKWNALHVSAGYSYLNGTSILKYLVENVDVSDIINELVHGQGPIHSAIIAGAESVKILLDRGADPRLKAEEKEDDDGSELLAPLHLAAMMRDEPDAAHIILGYDRTTIDQLDGLGRTPLVVAVINGADYVATNIIRRGALLSTYSKGTEKQSAIEMITTKLPDPIGFIEKVFDKFLHVGHSNRVDYELLTNEHEKDPLKVVEEFVRCGQRKVLVHPLIETLLYLKWSNLLPIYFLLLGTYAFFLLALNVFVGMVFYYGDRNETMSDTVTKIFWVDVAFLYVSICFLILQECICMRARGSLYWRSLESWLKLGSTALGVALPPLLLPVGTQVPSASRHAATAALLLGWLQMMFLVGRFPRWGYYVLMMAKVASNIAKVLLTSVFLVLGFALSFMIQFRVTPPFDGPLAAFTKTIVMMASEFDYENLFGKDHDGVLADTRTMVRWLFLLFLVFVSIVLMNLIVGVAVNDIHNLTVSGNVRRLQKQLELIRTLDTLVHDGVLEKILPGAIMSTINKRRLLSKMTLTAGTTKIWTVHCEDEDDNYQIRLPTYLYQAVVTNAPKLNEPDIYTRRVHNMVTMLYETHIHDNNNMLAFKEHLHVKPPSKMDDVLHELRKLNDLKEDLRKLRTFHYDDERHGHNRQRF